MKERNYLIDNCKAISIFFVVFGHAIENFAPYNNYLLLVIYTFHMPVFIFISGYLAKFNFKKMVKNILIPYLCMQLISYIFYSIYEPNNFYIFYAYTSLWYMLSLFSWYCLTKVLDKVKNKYLFFICSILFALLIGYDTSVGGPLSLSRTIVYFPIFMAGYFLNKKSSLEVFKKNFKQKILSATLFIIMCIILYFQKDSLSSLYFYGSMSYYGNYNIVFRFFAYICNFIGIYLFMTWVPSKRTFLSKIGKNSISVYLLHYLIIKFILYKEVNTYFNHPTIFSFVLSVFLVLLLSNNKIAKIFKK